MIYEGCLKIYKTHLHQYFSIMTVSNLLEQPCNKSDVTNKIVRVVKGKWQQTFLSAYLKETPKQYIEVYYRIFISALFGEIF